MWMDLTKKIYMFVMFNVDGYNGFENIPKWSRTNCKSDVN